MRLTRRREYTKALQSVAAVSALIGLVALSGCAPAPRGRSGVAVAEVLDPHEGAHPASETAVGADELVTEALAAKRAGRLEEAEAALRRALAIDPTCRSARWALGWVLANAGQSDEAIDHFRRFLAGDCPARARLEACAALQRLSRREERPAIALAFDDFPFPGQSEELLEILDEGGVRVTFFAIGRKVVAHPEIARQAAEADHSVQNHTWSHPRGSGLSDGEIREECRRCSDAIEEATGERPCVLRWPGARWSRGVELRAAECGLVAIDPIVTGMGDVNLGPGRIGEALRERAGAGRILAFHDGCSATRRALPEIIAALKRYRCRFVTVPELLGLEQPGGEPPAEPAAVRQIAPHAPSNAEEQ